MEATSIKGLKLTIKNRPFGLEDLNDKILKLGYNIIVGRVHSCDAFYNNLNINELYEKHECLAVEMESFALFHNAKALNKNILRSKRKRG